MPKLHKPIPTHGLVKMEPILEIIRAVIFTGYLSDERPLSLCLVAKPGAAKTEAFKYFSGSPSIRFISDITGNGLLGFKKEIESLGLRHFVLTDLLRVLAHGKNVGERTIQTFASLMEEGESETADPGGRTKWDNFPRIGVLMAITPDIFDGKAGKWRKTGFLSRFIVLRFSHRKSTTSLIQDAIEKSSMLPKACPVIPPKYKPATVKIITSHAHNVRGSSEDVTEDEQYPYRNHKQLRALTKGLALSHNRYVVTQKDVNKVKQWAEFFNGQEMII